MQQETITVGRQEPYYPNGDTVYDNTTGLEYRAWAYGTSHTTVRRFPFAPIAQGWVMTNEYFAKTFRFAA